MGNPRVVELLFLSEGVAVKRSPAWEELVSMRRMFLTERCITGYLAFIQSELAVVKKNIYLFRQVRVPEVVVGHTMQHILIERL
jgi:hypothetical protein